MSLLTSRSSLAVAGSLDPAPQAPARAAIRGGRRGRFAAGWGAAPPPRSVRARANDDENKPPSGDDGAPGDGLSLDTVNPLALGRKSRQVVDSIWKLFTGLGSTGGGQYGPGGTDAGVLSSLDDFESEANADTRVLVVGATGRVGRVLVRKLLLRGYSVRALVRPAVGAAASGATGTDPEPLPSKVEVVYGDLGDPSTLKAAVDSCTKVVCCSRARSGLAAELERVDHRGVYHLAKAFQDHSHAMAQRRAGRSAKSKLTLADFSRPGSLDGWTTVHGADVAPPGPPRAPGAPVPPTRPAAMLYGQSRAELSLSDRGNAIFSGYVYARNGSAEARGGLTLDDGYDLGRYEGLVLRSCGDGKPYTVVVYAGGRAYGARIGGRPGWATTRLPFSAFRPMVASDAPLEPGAITTIGLRYDSRRPAKPAASAAAAGGGARVMESKEDASANTFRLEVDFLKALPGGAEPDFVLVSCTGTAAGDAAERARVVEHKRAGEEALRNSGLGYTIVRPGLLVEEAGGQRALIFDQGDRITQRISCADVADVVLKALHDPAARNKSFDVCYEYTPEGSALYELIAHMPDKAHNYLTPALMTLEKNT